MSESAVLCNIGGLKCDAVGCDYVDRDIKLEEYEKYLNKPCPKCGANLLTEQDLAATKLLLAGSDYINAIIGPVEGGSRVKLVATMDGTGEIKIKAQS